MNSKQLKGLAVISIAEGEKLGMVTRADLDPAAKRVVGFAFAAPSGLFAPEFAPWVETARVHSLGPHALTLDDKRVVQDETGAETAAGVVELDSLLKRKVVTEGGTYVGQVASLEFDEQDFVLTQLEVSPGVFKGNQHVPIGQVMSIGPDLIIVTNAVCAPPDVTADSDAAGTAEHPWVVGDIEPLPRP